MQIALHDCRLTFHWLRKVPFKMPAHKPIKSRKKEEHKETKMYPIGRDGFGKPHRPSQIPKKHVQNKNGLPSSLEHIMPRKKRALNSVQVIDSNDAQSVESMARILEWSRPSTEAARRTSEHNKAQGSVCSVDNRWRFRRASRGNWGRKTCVLIIQIAIRHRGRAGATAVPYHSVDAYDLTFEKIDSQGKVLLEPHTDFRWWYPSVVWLSIFVFHGSGGYEIYSHWVSGRRSNRIESWDSPPRYRGRLPHRSRYLRVCLGTQGASGSTRFGYATYVDIVGTAEAVVLFASKSKRWNPNNHKTSTRASTNRNTSSFRNRHSDTWRGSSWARGYQTRNERRSGQAHSKPSSHYRRWRLWSHHTKCSTLSKRIRA